MTSAPSLLPHSSPAAHRSGPRSWLAGAIGLLLAGATCFTSLAATNHPPQPLTLPGIENAHQLAPRVYSGGQPEGEAAFAALAKLGIQTVISVDGARPDLEAARRHGLRYVHVPVGYDGIGTNQALLLAQAAVTLTGPVFIHCHHGKHRGPAAAALVCEAAAGWSATEAEAWLRQAGTSPDYPGLYRAVREARFPAPGALAARTNALPDYSPPPGPVAAMVEMDVRWEELLHIQSAGYRSPPDHPDLSPVHAAKLLEETLTEFARRPDTRERGEDFLRLAVAAEAAAAKLTKTFQAHAAAPAADGTNLLAAAYRGVSQSCSACHRAHRNGQ